MIIMIWYSLLNYLKEKKKWTDRTKKVEIRYTIFSKKVADSLAWSQSTNSRNRIYLLAFFFYLFIQGKIVCIC